MSWWWILWPLSGLLACAWYFHMIGCLIVRPLDSGVRFVMLILAILMAVCGPWSVVAVSGAFCRFPSDRRWGLRFW